MEVNEKLILDNGTGMYCRPNTIDRDVIREVINRNAYKNLVNKLEPEDIVLDLGAHIGTFANLVAPKVRKVFSFEPFPDNTRLFELNTKKFDNVILHKKAVSNENKEKIGFWFVSKFEGKEQNTGAGCTHKKRGREMIEVNNIHIDELFKEIQPTKIKCDVEGAEYYIFGETKIPESVKAIVFEIHQQRIADKENYEKLESNLINQGFKVQKPDNLFKDKSWYHTVYFER